MTDRIRHCEQSPPCRLPTGVIAGLRKPPAIPMLITPGGQMKHGATIDASPNSSRLIEDLERFHGLVCSNITRAAYYDFLDKLQLDIGAIKEKPIRARAMELFQHVQSGGYVLSKNPEMKASVVLPAIRRLINYLREAFGIPQS